MFLSCFFLQACDARVICCSCRCLQAEKYAPSSHHGRFMFSNEEFLGLGGTRFVSYSVLLLPSSSAQHNKTSTGSSLHQTTPEEKHTHHHREAHTTMKHAPTAAHLFINQSRRKTRTHHHAKYSIHQTKHFLVQKTTTKSMPFLFSFLSCLCSWERDNRGNCRLLCLQRR